jgi:ribonuclease R
VKNTSKPPRKPSSPSRSVRKPTPVIGALNAASLIAFLRQEGGEATKADIIQHFALSGQDHVTLRELVRGMIENGQLEKNMKQLVKLADTPKQKRKAVASGFIGIYHSQRRGGGLVKSTQRQDKTVVTVDLGAELGAHDGDLVEVKNNKIVRVVAAHKDANFVSLLAIRNFDVPDVFPEDVIAETDGMVVPPLGKGKHKRTDLRHLPLVTIDGEDARDFDDAVHAVQDDAADNKHGWVITVAIADVAHYVRPGSALDTQAFKRGNSLYFPDRVVPMLPEVLSNDMCSLRPDGPRACMAIIMRINANGHLISQQVVRGLMQSKARLTYTQVQHALNGHVDDTTKPILADVIMPLYGAYKCLLQARQERGTIDLDVPERKIILENGIVKEITPRERHESHKLIEEMMILANVAAATLLEEKNQPLLYRVHPKPDPSRLESTRNFLKEFNYHLKTGTSLRSSDFRQILRQVEGHDEELLINEVMLRTMSQAEYAPFNVGHFGLALERYAHFTSPIRRYADLIVHRALIKAYDLGDDGLTESEQNRLPAIGQHISDRERVAQSAERETIDRYVALYLQDKVGGIFPGRISGVTKAGLFITLDETGADGLLPMRLLPQDFFEHDEQRHMLIGRRSGVTFRLAQKITVELLETDSVTGRLTLQLAPGSVDPKAFPPRYRREKTEEPHRDRRDERRDGDRRGSPGGFSRNRDGENNNRNSARGEAPRGKFNDRDERRPFRERGDSDRAPRSFGDKPFGDRPPRTESQGDTPYRERKVYTRTPRTEGDAPPRFREDRSRDDRYPSDRPSRGRDRDERPRSFDDRPPRRERSFEDRPPRGDRPFGDKPPREDRPFGDRPPRGDRPFGDRPPRTERSDDRGGRGGWREERSTRGDWSDKPPARSPRGERSDTPDFGDRPPRGDRPFGDRPPRGDRPFGDRPPRGDRSSDDRRGGFKSEGRSGFGERRSAEGRGGFKDKAPSRGRSSDRGAPSGRGGFSSPSKGRGGPGGGRKPGGAPKRGR